jgi:cytochrome d ubiquinol oxidase subunit II
MIHDPTSLLPLVWALVIAAAVVMYVLLDGFDLGIGILFPLAPSHADRDLMMTSVAPVWDGNETWLVLGGGGLLAAFPLAYGVLMPALYVPIIIMLLALVLRGVAFEFRFKADYSRVLWDGAFSLGSLLAAFMQGVVLGAFVSGFAVNGDQFAGGAFDWLSPFTLMTGCGLVCGYALLGATWLIAKTEGLLQAWSRHLAERSLLAVAFFVALVSLWTPLAEPLVAARWFSWPRLLYLSPVPLVTAALCLGLWHSLRRGREWLPFLCTIGLFLLSFLGLGISLWPYAVPRALTIWQAAAQPQSQLFLLIGVAVLIPIILAYTGYSYWVFRGKVRPGEGYH